MGAALTHPISSQNLRRSGNAHFRAGFCEMQGFRINMEDMHSMRVSLSSKHPDLGFFAVFDGHAGDKAAIFLEQRLHEVVGQLEDPLDAKQLSDAMLRTDAEFLKREDERQHGSAAVMAVVRTPAPDAKDKKWEVSVANIGDSRVLLLRSDGSFVALTSDHKPELDAEKARINAAGGFVQQNRVDGQLAMSRAFGDWPYKDQPKLKPEEQKVIALPDVTTEVGREGDALLICCDGIYEQLSNEAVAAFVHETLKAHPDDPALVCSKLVIHSLEKGSKDNHSAMLVQLRSGEGYERKDEFIAGPFRPFQNDKKFVEAYFADAEKHGYRGPELIKMAIKAEENMPNIKEPEDINLAAIGQQLALAGGPDARQKLMLLALLSGGQLPGIAFPADDDEDGTEATFHLEDDDAGSEDSGSTAASALKIVEVTETETLSMEVVEEGDLEAGAGHAESASAPSSGKKKKKKAKR